MKDLSFPGNELSARRQELRLSIEDVYRKLHIPAEFVESIEEGKLASLPPMCYAVGFLTTYCELLELEPEKYADLLKDCVRPAPRFLGIPGTEENHRKPRWFSELIAWTAICAILVLGWVTYSVAFQPKTDRAEHQVEAVSIEDVSPSNEKNL